MKKIKLFIITIALFLTFGSIVNASTTTYERNSSNNFGVNKKWDMNQHRIGKAKATKYVDASEKIYDFSDILTEEEEEEIYLLIKEFIRHTGWDFAFVSDNVPWYSEVDNENYAADFYDYNDFGLENSKYDGVILFRNTYPSDKYYCAFTFGDAQLYFDKSRENRVLDDIYYDFKNGRYYEGIKIFIKEMTSFYDAGVVNKNEYVDRNGFVREEDKNFGDALFIAIPWAFVATVITIWILVARNKMIRKAYSAGEYLNRKTINFTTKSDVFVSTHTTHYTSSSSSGSSGGFSGGGSRSSSGSSGGGHSGGGRRG